MQQGQKTIRIPSRGRSQEAGSSVQDEGFGEIPKESTYARAGSAHIFFPALPSEREA